MRIYIIAVSVHLFFSSLFATSSLAQERELFITLYQNNLGLVHDIRTVKLKTGTQEIRLTDVAALINPATVHIKAVAASEKVTILEQNYEYDVISLDALLHKYIGQTIKVFTEDAEGFEGKLLYGSNKNIILERPDGGILSFSLTHIHYMSFPTILENLSTKPALILRLTCKEAGDHRMELSYLTEGIEWQTEYVAMVHNDESKVDLSAWVSIKNQSGTDYTNTRLKLVAGDIHRSTPPYPRYIAAYDREKLGKLAAAAPQFEEKPFFGYHIYDLQRTITIKNNQFKQLSLFPLTTTAVKKVYEYEGWKNESAVHIKLELTNSVETGLGIPLPAGKVRVYKYDEDGSQIFLGEDTISHTPKEAKIRIFIGTTTDLTGERRRIDYKKIGDRIREETWQITLSNHKKTDTEILLTEHLKGDWKIIESNHAYRKKDANTIEFSIPVKQGSEATIEYTVLCR